MNDAAAGGAPTPTYASVLYLRLDGFAGKPVVEQARLRAQLEAVAAAGLSLLPDTDRVVLDASDGLAIVVLGNAVGALAAAERCLDAASVLPLSIGAGHGAVAPVAGPDAVQGMLGDGLQSAAVAAGFATPGQLLATLAFREAVAQESPGRLADLPRAGTYSDATVRAHELFVLDGGARHRRRKRLLGVALAGMALILAGGYVGRLAYRAEGPFAPDAQLLLAVSPAGELWVDGVAHGSSPPLESLRLRPGRHAVELRHGDDPPLQVTLDLRPGEQRQLQHSFTPLPVVAIEVSPSGELFVDGQPRGPISGRRRLQLAEGRHAIEVRNPPYATYQKTLELHRGQEVALKHVFAPAVVFFKVTPGGQVYVNGVARGVLPTLRRLELPPGKYLIEVHHGRHDPYQRTVELKEGQRIAITHVFKDSFFKRLFEGGG